MILFLAGVMIVPTVYVLMDGGTLKQEDNVRKDFLRHFREKKKILRICRIEHMM